MGKETSNRIQTSILNGVEKKILVWLAQRQPKSMTSDILTYIGLLGAALYMLGGWLSNMDLNFLWISSFGLFLNWYGDSLDGTLARVRNAQRPVYGFFIDHTLDAIAVCMILLGAGFSPLLRMDISLFILSGYLCLSIYTYICTIIKGEFRLTYGFLGPTELRLLLVTINTLYIYMPCMDKHYCICRLEMGILDIIGMLIGVVLFLAYICQQLKDGRALAKQDPLP